MKKLLFLYFIILFQALKSQVIINEIQPANGGIMADDKGDFDDWIELYNTSDAVIDIAGLVLKDNVDTWAIPSGLEETKLQPHSYFILWADDEENEGSFHTNFKLSASNGEFLGLYKADSVTVIDSITFPPMSDGYSYGRCGDDFEWTLFLSSTPTTVNNCPDFIDKNKINDQLEIYVENKEIVLYNKLSAAIYNIKVVDITGKMIFSSKENINNEFRITSNNLKQGIFLIKVWNNKQSYFRKFMLN